VCRNIILADDDNSNVIIKWSRCENPERENEIVMSMIISPDSPLLASGAEREFVKVKRNCHASEFVKVTVRWPVLLPITARRYVLVGVPRRQRHCNVSALAGYVSGRKEGMARFLPSG
jgi:hypothetical protein